MPIYCNTYLYKIWVKLKNSANAPSPQTKKKSIGRLSLDADQPTMNRRVAKSPRTILPIKMKKGRLTAGKCKISSQDSGLEVNVLAHLQSFASKNFFH